MRPQAAGLANAILRRLAEDAETFPWGDPETDDAALARLYGHPLWLAERWIAELGRRAAATTMAADNEPAPLFLAVNPFGGSRDGALNMLRNDGADPQECPPPGCIVAREPGAAVRGKALADGRVVAVDAAAQLVAAKTLLMQGHAVSAGGPANLTAVDVHEFKTRLLEERLSILGVPGVTTLTADATALDGVASAPAPGTADAVLVDAPCSGLGTLRRHPEKRWRVSADDIASLSDLGSRLLTATARLVRTGGFVVYSTCTLANAENADVIDAFLASEGGRAFVPDSLGGEIPEQWRRWLDDRGRFRSLPEPGGPDGHFVVRLRRTE